LERYGLRLGSAYGALFGIYLVTNGESKVPQFSATSVQQCACHTGSSGQTKVQCLPTLSAIPAAITSRELHSTSAASGSSDDSPPGATKTESASKPLSPSPVPVSCFYQLSIQSGGHARRNIRWIPWFDKRYVRDRRRQLGQLRARIYGPLGFRIEISLWAVPRCSSDTLSTNPRLFLRCQIGDMWHSAARQKLLPLAWAEWEREELSGPVNQDSRKVTLCAT